jgi:hypothetical protein
LRRRKLARKEPWNFIAWVMEFHESGYVHIHTMWYGGWVARFDELQELWGVCDNNGIRKGGKKGSGITSGKGLCYYLTKYLSKDLQSLAVANNDETIPLNKYAESLAAMLWYFRRRLYNFRHYMIDDEGNKVWGIPGEQFEKKGSWRLYQGTPGEVVLEDGSVAWYDPGGVRIGKRIDDYLAACDDYPGGGGSIIR